MRGISCVCGIANAGPTVLADPRLHMGIKRVHYWVRLLGGQSTEPTGILGPLTLRGGATPPRRRQRESRRRRSSLVSDGAMGCSSSSPARCRRRRRENRWGLADGVKRATR